jgi:hypothetical protein
MPSAEQLELRIDAGAIAAVRELIAARGGRPAHLADRALAQLLDRVPDVDLAATAVVMEPRPAWVAELIPHGAGLTVKAR